MADTAVFLATQLPSNGWYEGMVVLPDATLLVARVDEPELYHVDPGAGDAAEPRLLYTFHEPPEIQSIINICPMPGRPDEFALLLGNVDLFGVGASGFQIWRLVLSVAGDAPPQASRVAHLDAGLALGMVAISDRLLLVTDSQRCCIHCIDTATGSTSVFLEDEAFTKDPDGHPLGLTRLCVDNRGYLWFANSNRRLLGRVPIALDGGSGGPEGRSARATGPVEIMGGLMPSSDGLALAPDGSAAFTTTVNDGQLWRLDLAKGTPISVLKSDLVNPSAVGLDARGVVYVICNGEIEIGWKTDDLERPWREISDINDHVTVSVTVTEEVEG